MPTYILQVDKNLAKSVQKQNTVSKVTKDHEAQTMDDTLQRPLLTMKQAQRYMRLCK